MFEWSCTFIVVLPEPAAAHAVTVHCKLLAHAGGALRASQQEECCQSGHKHGTHAVLARASTWRMLCRLNTPVCSAYHRGVPTLLDSGHIYPHQSLLVQMVRQVMSR
jgi:hypothetical protein